MGPNTLPQLYAITLHWPQQYDKCLPLHARFHRRHKICITHFLQLETRLLYLELYMTQWRMEQTCRAFALGNSITTRMGHIMRPWTLSLSIFIILILPVLCLCDRWSTYCVARGDFLSGIRIEGLRRPSHLMAVLPQRSDSLNEQISRLWMHSASAFRVAANGLGRAS